MGRSQEDQPLVITPGDGGWAHVAWHGGRPDEIVAYVRFAYAPGERRFLHAAELRVLEPWISRHRGLPLSRVEHAVNANPDVWYQLHQTLDDDPGPDPVKSLQVKAAFDKARTSRLMLRRPEKRRLDDDFYMDVARAYADAVAIGRDPRKTLAIDSETPADTVARWIRKAREKGYLTAAEPGKASGALTIRDET